MIVSSRANAAHSRPLLALWLITFAGVLIQLGLCSLDLPPDVGFPGMLAPAPAGACWVAGGDRTAGYPAPDLHRLLRDGLRAGSVTVQRRTAGLTAIGVLPACLLLAAWIGAGRGGPGPRVVGRLLIRLCVSRI